MRVILDKVFVSVYAITDKMIVGLAEGETLCRLEYYLLCFRHISNQLCDVQFTGIVSHVILRIPSIVKTRYHNALSWEQV